VKEDEMGRTCSTNWEKKNTYRLLVGKRPRHMWLYNIGEVGWGDVNWIGLALDRNRWRAVVNSVLNLQVP
jgi:hypothetical protein